jgi:hypothetical protein
MNKNKPDKTQNPTKPSKKHTNNDDDNDEVQCIMAFPVRRRQAPASGQNVIDLDSD